ncbi:MAG: hypothetical protein QMD20_02575 [Candidatus Bathyarchaeia archaeon]|nr:hypothetical protein [Candidatus Bathyarchaeia archaeon]
MINEKLSAKNVALIVCFAALYTVFGFIPVSPIIGLSGKAITAASIMAPIMGIILGPHISTLSTILGGIIAFFMGFFSPPSLVSGAAATLCSGLLSHRKQSACIFTYFSLLFVFGFYPFVGPVWLYPPLMWFQLAGFILLISPLSFKVIKNLNSKNSSELFPAFFTIFLIATLAGQIAGSLAYEVLAWPVFMADVDAWRGTWQVLTFIYPVERIIIALISAFIGTPLYKIFKTANLMLHLNSSGQQEKRS